MRRFFVAMAFIVVVFHGAPVWAQPWVAIEITGADPKSAVISATEDETPWDLARPLAPQQYREDGVIAAPLPREGVYKGTVWGSDFDPVPVTLDASRSISVKQTVVVKPAPHVIRIILHKADGTPASRIPIRVWSIVHTDVPQGFLPGQQPAPSWASRVVLRVPDETGAISVPIIPIPASWGHCKEMIGVRSPVDGMGNLVAGDNSAEALVLSLQPAGTIHGVVLAADGAPAKNCVVQASAFLASGAAPPRFMIEIQRNSPAFLQGVASAITDDQGRFSIHDLITGPNYLVMTIIPNVGPRSIMASAVGPSSDVKITPDTEPPPMPM